MKYYACLVTSRKYSEMDEVIHINEVSDNISLEEYDEIVNKSVRNYKKHLYVKQSFELSQSSSANLVPLATTLRVCSIVLSECRKQRIINFLNSIKIKFC